jgi:hypothetical protein
MRYRCETADAASVVSAEERSSAESRVAHALRRLDPYSFFPLPGQRWGGLFVVVGTTGSFLIGACDHQGVARIEGLRPTVGSHGVGGLRKLRRGSKALERKLVAASMPGEVVPMMCLTHAIAGPPVTTAGVRFATVRDLAKDISARPSVQANTRAQSAARALGVQLAGDAGRNFTVRS